MIFSQTLNKEIFIFAESTKYLAYSQKLYLSHWSICIHIHLPIAKQNVYARGKRAGMQLCLHLSSFNLRIILIEFEFFFLN